MLSFNIVLIVLLCNTIISLFFNKKTELYCGLVGFSGKQNYNADKIGTLFLHNYLERGKDATGVYTPKTGLVKDNDPLFSFVKRHGEKVLRDKLLIGHVRAKTVGFNSKDNAHPFVYNDIVLAHNGTLNDWKDLAKEMGLNPRDYEVDSQILAASLSKHLNPYVFQQMDGAAAVLFTDKQYPDVLHVYRNSDRPLFKGDIEGNMYISSIKDSLEMIGCKNVNDFLTEKLYTIVDGKVEDIHVVKQRNVTIWNNKNNSNSSYTSGVAEDHLNKWVLCDSSYETEKYNISKDKFYFCTEVKDIDLKIKNDKNQTIFVPRHKFSFNYGRTFPYDKRYVVTTDLTWTDGKRKGKTACTKGDVCKLLGVTSEKGNHELYVELIRTGEKITIDHIFCRQFNPDAESIIADNIVNTETKEILDKNKIKENKEKEDDKEIVYKDDSFATMDTLYFISAESSIDEIFKLIKENKQMSKDKKHIVYDNLALIKDNLVVVDSELQSGNFEEEKGGCS